jgi:serine/threonine-protein kinase HipA
MDTALVLLHQRPVGTLQRLNEDQDFVFAFEEAWLDDPLRPVLGQLFEDRKPRALKTSGLPCWFAHLLPQGPWRRHLQRWAGLDLEDNDDFGLLLAMGHDLPGAVTLAPLTRSGPGAALVRAAAPLEAPSGYKFSLAGAQWKLSVQRDKQLLAPVYGQQGAFIAKFEALAFPHLPRVEGAATQWARLAGIDAHSVELLSTDEFIDLPAEIPNQERRCLLLRRFDRSPQGAIHMEDFGQVSDIVPANLYKSSYEAIGALIRWLCPEDKGEYIKRLVFMVLSGNGDAHLKNWSVLYPDGRTARLSPAYDLVPTVLYNPNDDLALTLNGSKSFVIDASALAPLARALDLGHGEVARLATDAWEQIRDTWARERLHLDLTDNERGRLQQHLDRLPARLAGP